MNVPVCNLPEYFSIMDLQFAFMDVVLPVGSNRLTCLSCNISALLSVYQAQLEGLLQNWWSCVVIAVELTHYRLGDTVIFKVSSSDTFC